MSKIKVSCDLSLTFNKKPNSMETAKITSQLPKHTLELNSNNLKEISRRIGEDGVPFCPATFINGSRKSENFEQLQFLALDFDNKNPDKKLSFDEVKKRAQRYHIPLLFAYDTMSSTNHDRFRVVFLNDVSVPDKKAAEIMIDELFTIFPEADKSCKDVSRLFYGGKHLLYFDDTVPEINIQSLTVGMCRYLQDRYGKANYKRKITEFNNRNGIVPNPRNMPSITMVDALPLMQKGAESPVFKNDENSPESIIYTIIGFGEKSLNRYYTISLSDNTGDSVSEGPKGNSNNRNQCNHMEYRSSVIADLYKSCKLFNEFTSGSRVLSHMELFGLATNITKIETGSKLFMDVISRDPYLSKNPDKTAYWSYNFKYFIFDYKPYCCDKYCPYSNECTHGANMLSALKLPYHNMVKIENYNPSYVSLEEAYHDQEQALKRAVNSLQPQWHIIKAQTSLGKTESYLNLIKESKNQILIAVPTNKLKSEIVLRAQKKGVKIVASPSLHELKDEISEEAWDDIQKMYETGIDAMGYIRARADKNNKEYEPAFEKYVKQLELFTHYEGCAITTHRRLLNLDTKKYDLVIVDEDIIFSSIVSNRIEIPVSSLMKLYKKTKSNPSGKLLFKKTKKMFQDITHHHSTEDYYFTLPAVLHQKEDYNELSEEIGINVSAFASATNLCYHPQKNSDKILSGTISFLADLHFNENTKFIMVSATADKVICEYCFGAENIEFYECKPAQYAGKLYQYYQHSMSRAYIDDNPSIIDRIEALTKVDCTITFKKYLKNNLYFGNTAGCDYMKGKNINVIGTPHQPESIYKLFAHFLKLDCDLNDKIRPNCNVVRNGYAFRFTTYTDEYLRAIQFYLIESELEQAIGRARLLRYDCTVILFSNYPIKQAIMKEGMF